MKEKFANYEQGLYLQSEGTFKFTITSYELTTSAAGNDMAMFEVSSEEGDSKLYFPLTPKAKWKYNQFIKAILHDQLDTNAKIKAFELDYETIGRELIGKTFLGDVESETYQRETKIPNPDGTFRTVVEDKVAYKIVGYYPTI